MIIIQKIQTNKQMFGDRHLNFNKFLEERAEQISKFRDILKLQTKKKGHQALPKSIRRRAMSHNRYRIPSKMRKLHEQQLIKNQNMQKLPKCRKHIRKRSRLILNYKARFSKIKWLSTHLWAARRMRMINYHGYKVAQTPNQKAFRSSYRQFRHNCCMIDLSYYQCLKVVILGEQSKLPQNIVITEKKKSQKYTQLQQTHSYQAHLFNNNRNFICPLIIFKSHQKSLKCFFHPTALDQVQQLISNQTKQEQMSFKLTVEKYKCQIYQLIGPEWANKVTEALKIYGMNLSQNEQDILKYQTFGVNYYLSENQKIIEKVPHISIPQNSMIKQQFNSNQMSQSIREKTLKLFKKLKGQQNETKMILEGDSQKFWQFYDKLTNQGSQITFTITNRSKYTHKRKNKMSKQIKKKVINLQKRKRQLINNINKNIISEQQPDSQMISESLESIKNEIKQIFIEKNNKQAEGLLNKDGKKEFKVDPVVVSTFRQGENNFFEGCYVICGDSDNCRLWKILTKINVKVIGLQEFKQVCLESQRLNFPNDYPSTKSFKNLCENYSIKQFETFRRKPPQKRINFLKVNSPNPLSCLQPQIASNCMTVFIEMVNKGRCFSNSYIYQLTQNDIEFIESKLSNDGHVGIVLSEFSSKQNKFISKNKESYFDYATEGYDKLLQKLSELKKKQKRRLIGRMTTGGYLFSRSKQGGIGYVTKIIGENIEGLENYGYVLIRKVSSPFYYLGCIRKIISQNNQKIN